ncbi:hypothetical protein [Corynebacterium wankanglinii]|uniref:HTH cro/C1-type domain-containing protein n=1 Tax=Corynebacterium wankanglinii TaxID=2735136 RepID=A0A838CGN7_9CORY|nr:hypothetical protein [Corynebacterium wankanglinii]MBA1834135.1 hypothetical protein [Corynebacterium wankanglinii]
MAFQIRPEVLDKIRVEQDLNSDEALAHHLGLSLGTIHGLRKGRTPTVPTLVRVMDAANVKFIKSAIVNHAKEDNPAA